MDQRPGQNVDLGLYFHMEGPVSPKIMPQVYMDSCPMLSPISLVIPVVASALTHVLIPTHLQHSTGTNMRLIRPIAK